MKNFSNIIKIIDPRRKLPCDTKEWKTRFQEGDNSSQVGSFSKIHTSLQGRIFKEDECGEEEGRSEVDDRRGHCLLIRYSKTGYYLLECSGILYVGTIQVDNGNSRLFRSGPSSDLIAVVTIYGPIDDAFGEALSEWRTGVRNSTSTGTSNRCDTRISCLRSPRTCRGSRLARAPLK